MATIKHLDEWCCCLGASNQLFYLTIRVGLVICPWREKSNILVNSRKYLLRHLKYSITARLLLSKTHQVFNRGQKICYQKFRIHKPQASWHFPRHMTHFFVVRRLTQLSDARRTSLAAPFPASTPQQVDFARKAGEEEERLLLSICDAWGVNYPSSPPQI